METRDADGTLIKVGDTVRRIHYIPLDFPIKREVKVKSIEGSEVWGDDGISTLSWDLKVIAKKTMSKPDSVPNSAIFYANSGINTLHADPYEDQLNIWINSDNDAYLSVELSRERVRKVAQALLRWADGTEGPEEI